MGAKIGQVLSGELDDTDHPDASSKKYMESLGVDPEWATTSLTSATDDQGAFPSFSTLVSFLLHLTLKYPSLMAHIAYLSTMETMGDMYLTFTGQ